MTMARPVTRILLWICTILPCILVVNLLIDNLPYHFLPDLIAHRISPIRSIPLFIEDATLGPLPEQAPSAAQSLLFGKDAGASSRSDAKALSYLDNLLVCNRDPNPITGHLDLSNILQNISHITPQTTVQGGRRMFNPTILALPSWSENEYLLVSRVVTEGLHQEAVICEANTCYSDIAEGQRVGERICSSEDIDILGPSGGLRCATEPKVVNIPPTPADQCNGKWTALVDIPGFHDPRIFWSGRGEPLIIVNSHSQYGCLGLWIQDLRMLHPPLERLIRTRDQPQGPLVSYPYLTELTRAPKTSRNQIEKNWFLFFPTAETAYVHYDIGPKFGRAFAKLIGNGFTTENLTDAQEESCLSEDPDNKGRKGQWHQASNSLKLILCRRDEAESGQCNERESGRTVHVALIHRKFTNDLDLPMRYERRFIVWSSHPPFRVLATSQHPLLLANETAKGWDRVEVAAEDAVTRAEDRGREPVTKRFTPASNDPLLFSSNDSNHSKPASPSPLAEIGTIHKAVGEPADHSLQSLAYFFYTPSINWAHRYAALDDQRQGQENELINMQCGYLDDEVILGIGLDDLGQAFARVQAQTLLSCLKKCPTMEGQVDVASNGNLALD